MPQFFMRRKFLWRIIVDCGAWPKEQRCGVSTQSTLSLSLFPGAAFGGGMQRDPGFRLWAGVRQFGQHPRLPGGKASRGTAAASARIQLPGNWTQIRSSASEYPRRCSTAKFFGCIPANPVDYNIPMKMLIFYVNVGVHIKLLNL